MAEAAELDQRGRGDENLLASTMLTKAPHSSVRTTVRTIVVVVGLLIVAMWTAVGFSVLASRQTALDDARLQGHNLMVAFREEVAHILRGVDGEMDLIAEKMRREPGSFNLYAWSQERVLVAPGMAQATIIDPNGMLQQTTIEPHPRSIDLSDRSHFRIHLDGRFHGLAVGQTVITRLSGVPALPLSRRVDAETVPPWASLSS